METYKRWILNGLSIFVSMGGVALKAIWDSWLLETEDAFSFQAFALLFPIIVLVNTISVSFANSVTGTVSKWTHEGKAQLRIAVYFVAFSIVLGVMTALLISSLSELVIAWFDADKYSTQITTFAEALIWWLPLQYIMVIFAQLSRFLGLFRSSSSIQLVSSFIGAALSYFLITHTSFLDPLEGIVYSNAIMALVASFLLLVLLLSHLDVTSGLNKVEIKPLLSTAGELFYTTFISQILAVVFIFIVTHQVSQKGEAVLSLMVYLFRAEQLILVMAGSFISVILPDIIRMAKKEEISTLCTYLNRSDKFLLVVNSAVAMIVSSLICIKVLFESQLDETSISLIFMTFIWLSGTILQGNVILFSQVLNVVFSPISAFKLNVSRFVLIGIPLIYLASLVNSGVVVAISLLAINLMFLPLYRKKTFYIISERYS